MKTKKIALVLMNHAPEKVCAVSVLNTTGEWASYPGAYFHPRWSALMTAPLNGS